MNSATHSGSPGVATLSRATADRPPRVAEQASHDQRSVCNARFALHFLSPVCTTALAHGRRVRTVTTTWHQSANGDLEP